GGGGRGGGGGGGGGVAGGGGAAGADGAAHRRGARARRRLRRPRADQPLRPGEGGRARRPGAPHQDHPRPGGRAAGRRVRAEESRGGPAAGPRRAGAALPAHPRRPRARVARPACPPIRTAGGRGPRPLPADTTSLVGREQAIGELAGLLAGPGVRLVTLTGPGGVGKTRLALAVGERAGGRFDSGAVFVALAGVTAPELVVGGIGRAVGADLAGAG